ncbi:MAG: FAD-dependent oxidoreductase [Candidatus Omnitrophica bacterium]|nr:FAD-dependent oxidoreductase [Candidatus Omnitrophota bacterium]
MTHTTDVLIVGGGVIGCAIARDLSIRGYKTVILERGEPCREASWAAAGALIARALSADEGPFAAF